MNARYWAVMPKNTERYVPEFFCTRQDARDWLEQRRLAIPTIWKEWKVCRVVVREIR